MHVCSFWVCSLVHRNWCQNHDHDYGNGNGNGNNKTQAQWTAMTEASERGNDHDHDRFSRHSRRKDATHFSSNSRGGVSSRDSFLDSTVRRNYPTPSTASVGGVHDSAAPMSGGGKGKKEGLSEVEAAAVELEREVKAKEDREKLKEARKVTNEVIVIVYDVM